MFKITRTDDVVVGESAVTGMHLAQSRYGDNSDQDYAARILYEHRRYQRLLASGNVDEAIYSAASLWRLATQADLERDAARGASLSGGRKRGARNDLSRVVLEILRDDHEKSSKDVLKALKQNPQITIEFDSRKRAIIKWRHPRTGTRHKTTWRSFENSLLPRLRQQLRKQARGLSAR